MAEAPSTKRSRRPRVRTVVFVLLLAWLIGRGLGWIGSGGTAADPESRSTLPVEAPTAAADAAAAGAAAVPEGGARSAEVDAGEALAAASAAVPLVEPKLPAVPAAVAVPAIDADRFASMLSLVTQATGERQFGSALASLQHLRTLPLDAAQQAVLLPIAADLQRELGAVCGELAQRLVQGQLLLAHRELATLLAQDALLLRDGVQQALLLAGLEVGIGRDRRREDATLPIPRPLPRGRAVRCLRDGVVVEGRVVDGRSDVVTVRLPNARGVTFPTVDVVACEPIAPSASEAVEMGFAALQRDEVLLARLWLALARRSGGADAARLARLAELLP